MKNLKRLWCKEPSKEKYPLKLTQQQESLAESGLAFGMTLPEALIFAGLDRDTAINAAEAQQEEA